MSATHAIPPDDHRQRLTRRQFLARSVMVAGAASVAGGSFTALAASPSGAPADDKPDVVQVRCADVITARGLHEAVLLDALHTVLHRLTNRDPVDAWRSILQPDDVVALKFNRSGANELGTSGAMLRVVVQSLTKAGFHPQKLVAVEVSEDIRSETGTVAPLDGWDADEVDFGSGRDQLASWLGQVTAIINIPFLKTHNLAGVTSCLKNLSHAVIKHPAQFHANGCAPYIGDIVALPAVRGKLRLHLVNALRIVFDGGPSAREDCIWDAGTLLGSFDPVALDCVGLQFLDRVRATLNLPEISFLSGPPAYLGAAAAQDLGRDQLHQIRVCKVSM